ncbi:helix-turn-helix domain-containing protein [Microbacterium sp. ANT_H45B]|uniref:helix-turn-helix domain-containing protein n=1 Tax=Microbacterium sp. ANT_H45B TaxID=2597346 RepID=UPI00165DDDA1|nr:helix-turn-helix domain-containing protein [Microbacterium sp. ANT_H45B]
MSAGTLTTNLGQLTERLGTTLLTLEAGRAQAARRVSTVVLHDPLDPPELTQDAIVLAVAVASDDDLKALVRQAGEARAAALIIREALPVSREVAAIAEQCQVSLFGLVRGASWVQVATLIISALNLGPAGAEQTANDPARDLFTLADAVSALLGAPVTIEDRSSRVVAFSANQLGTDEARRLTILGLQVPEEYSNHQRMQGVFPLIYGSERPIFLAKPAPDTLPRVAMRIAAGDEVLGSIWAVTPEPFDAERELRMIEAAQIMGLAMLRARVSADAAERVAESLGMMLLDGGSSAGEAAQQLGFERSAACVLVLGPLEDEDEIRAMSDTQRATAALRMHLRSVHPRAIAIPLGGLVYAVVPLRSTDEHALAAVERLAADFVGRLDTATEFCAGLGDAVAEVSSLSLSRRNAEAALRVLRSRPQRGGRVARFSDVQIDALMFRVGDLLAADGVTLDGPLLALREYDMSHRTELVATLRAWLEHFGDVVTAARDVHIHKNTFRYRLERIETITGMDLRDPDTRFGLLLQLRLEALVPAN